MKILQLTTRNFQCAASAPIPPIATKNVGTSDEHAKEGQDGSPHNGSGAIGQYEEPHNGDNSSNNTTNDQNGSRPFIDIITKALHGRPVPKQIVRVTEHVCLKVNKKSCKAVIGSALVQ